MISILFKKAYFRRRNFGAGIVIVAALSFTPLISLAETPQKIHRLELSSNVSISVPEDWVVLQGEREIRVEQYVAPAIKKAGVSENQFAAVQLILNANNSNKKKYAGITITLNRNEHVTRDMVSRATQNDISQTEKQLVSVTNKIFLNLGTTTRDWTPLSKVKIGTRDALVISYVRVSKVEDTRATQYMFSGDGGMFTVTVSSVLSNEPNMSNTLSKMVQSFTY